MKLSTKLLGGLGVLTVAALFSANIAMKQDYDNTDKDSFYWGYGKILEQPFTHISTEGGNITQIAFEQNEKPSVRVLKQWPGYRNGSVKAFVRADTLFLKFPNGDTAGDNAKVKDWIKHTTLVRIFAPQLSSIDGFDTDFDLLKLHQKYVSVNLSGRSAMEIETSCMEMDSLRVVGSNASNILLETSPDVVAGSIIRIRSADIHLQGTSKLDLGPTQVSSLRINVADSALINLSGFSVNKINHQRAGSPALTSPKKKLID